MRTGPHNHHLVMSQQETTPVPPGICDRRCTRPLGVIGLAMRRHSLEVHSTLGSRPTRHAVTLPHGSGAVCTLQPVQYSGHSVSPARGGSVDRSQLVASCGGAPRPLAVDGLAMRRLSLTKPVSFWYIRCTPTLGSRRTRHAAALPPRCHRGVTLVPPWCHSSATVVSP